ncbi:MAG: P-loop NTPase [Spirochaetes bacterium]|nr:P-loop NTPase [Spirochaetota bacterium]
MNTIIPIASGKGGVGKTILAANLGPALAGRGKTVVLVDLDLGGSNLHTCLGVRNTQPGIGALIWKKERKLENVLVGTDIERLHFVPGDNLMPGAANLEFFVKNRIVRELGKLASDYVILDLGAGTSYNVVDFFLLSFRGIVVVRPEITSVLNAYSLLKTCAYRMLFRSFAKKSPERGRVTAFVADRLEGSGRTFLDLARELARDFHGTAAAALGQLSGFVPRVVANQARSAEEVPIFRKLREVVSRNLGIGLEFSAFLPDDPWVPVSVAERTPLFASRPDAPFSKAVDGLAEAFVSRDPSLPPRLFDDDLDAEAARSFAEAGLAGVEAPDSGEAPVDLYPGDEGPSL